jgi:hypothetical protein
MLLEGDVLVFPLATGFDLPFAPVGQVIGVRPVIVLALRDKGLVEMDYRRERPPRSVRTDLVHAVHMSL